MRELGAVEAVATLPGSEAMGRTVIGAYPSSLVEAPSVPMSIVAYGVLTEEQAATIEPADCALESRQARVRAFNDALRSCKREAPADFLDALCTSKTALEVPAGRRGRWRSCCTWARATGQGLIARRDLPRVRCWPPTRARTRHTPPMCAHARESEYREQTVVTGHLVDSFSALNTPALVMPVFV